MGLTDDTLLRNEERAADLPARLARHERGGLAHLCVGRRRGASAVRSDPARAGS